MSKMKRTKYRSLDLPLAKIEPHPLVQRCFDKVHGDNIAANFDPDAFGELYVVKHGVKDKYLVWDGQHRRYAAEVVLGRDQDVPCRLYEDIPTARLAQIQWMITRGRKAWRPIDLFRQKVLAKNPTSIEIQKIVEGFGLHLHDQKTDGAVSAVAALEWVHTVCGPDELRRVLGILSKAWGVNPDAYHTNLLRGAGLVVHRHNGGLNDAELAAKLKGFGMPYDLVGGARSKSKNERISPTAATASLLVNIYNKKRTTRRLETWQ
jgi:hypothetical protein